LRGHSSNLNGLARPARTDAILVEGDTFLIPREDPQELDLEVIETRRRLVDGPKANHALTFKIRWKWMVNYAMGDQSYKHEPLKKLDTNMPIESEN